MFTGSDDTLALAKIAARSAEGLERHRVSDLVEPPVE
jgi:hypothetical protein